MGDKTGIEWTEATWNPTTGCDQVSDGCDFCYALTLAKRLKGMGSRDYQRDGDPRTSGPGFGLSMHPHRLDQPLRWTKPRMIFVNSMSDLFHADVTYKFIVQVFAVMALAERHTFQILTKRHARMRSVLSSIDFWRSVSYAASDRAGYDVDATGCLPNVWLGVSVEDQHWADIRVPALLETPAAVRFLSCEPLLGPVSLLRWLNGGFGHVAPDLHWVIAGGESGAGARPMHPDWARELRDDCQAAGVPFLFKQWGGRTPKANGRELDGRTWEEYPAKVVAAAGEPV
jgi:protein gp37